MTGLTNLEVMRIVNRYIGVTGGYLGDFSYRTHADFYSEYCDLSINPHELQGTTRERFLTIISSASSQDQAKIVRGVVERFPVGEGPNTRTEELKRDLLVIASRLEGEATAVAAPTARFTSAVVHRALSDAETLIRERGATSGVDRVHTALHGYLISACESAEIQCAPRASVTALLQLLRAEHPRLNRETSGGQNVTQILRGLASIVEATNSVRDTASVAHPSAELLEQPEAMLVVNACRSILQYLDTKLG
jgi:hypothetical protein